MFGFSLDNYAPIIGSNEVMAEALKIINVVPNPYYAYSSYELSRLDTRVKIINLPDKCEVKIYNVSGKLIKTYKKDSPITSIEWDLKNSKGIPVASGVYLIHVDVPGVGERILKFFGGMRQPDMENI
jgi:flagellar hook assembly protein FlgD